MFRVIVLLLATCLTVQAVASRTGRSFGLVYGDSAEELPIEVSKAQGLDIGNVVSLIFGIKNQVRLIIEEIAIHIFRFLKETVHQFKINLLKKLGQYTLSNIFHIIFDGVTDFVAEATPADSYAEIFGEPEKSDDIYKYLPPYYRKRDTTTA